MGDNNIPGASSDMSFEESHAEMERVCSILESISKNYAADSDEGIAIRDATLAYTVVYQRRSLARAYWRLRFALNDDASEMAKIEVQLRRHGIDPDELMKQIEEEFAVLPSCPTIVRSQ